MFGIRRSTIEEVFGRRCGNCYRGDKFAVERSLQLLGPGNVSDGQLFLSILMPVFGIAIAVGIGALVKYLRGRR